MPVRLGRFEMPKALTRDESTATDGVTTRAVQPEIIDPVLSQSRSRAHSHPQKQQYDGALSHIFTLSNRCVRVRGLRKKRARDGRRAALRRYYGQTPVFLGVKAANHDGPQSRESR